MDEPRIDERLLAGVGPADLGAVEVTGDDRVSFLHNVFTQHVAEMEPGEVRGALYLDAHGRPVAMADVAVKDERILLVTPTSALAGDVAETLGGRTFLADARFFLLDVSAAALRGEEASRVADKAGLSVDAGRVTEIDGTQVLGRPDGVDVIGPAAAVDALVDRIVEHGGERVSGEVLEAWRVAHGRPAWGREIHPPHLPEEAGVLWSHVHLDKGCYPGQEAVARMWMLGRPRRRLALVERHGDDATEGWSFGEGRNRVEVTSAARYADTRPGLAYVPVDAEVGARFGDADASVEVVALVGEDEEIRGRDPTVVRRRDRRP